MSEEKNTNEEVVEVNSSNKNKANAKNETKKEKKPNFFVSTWRKIGKFTADVKGEMMKVVWTSKDDLRKSSKLVLATVVVVAVSIAVVDTLFSFLINSVAGLFG